MEAVPSNLLWCCNLGTNQLHQLHQLHRENGDTLSNQPYLQGSLGIKIAAIWGVPPFSLWIQLHTAMTSSGTPHVPLDSSDVPHPIRRRHIAPRQLPQRHDDPATGEVLPSYQHGEPRWKKNHEKSFAKAESWQMDLSFKFLKPHLWFRKIRWCDVAMGHLFRFLESKLCTNLSMDSKRRCPSSGCDPDPWMFKLMRDSSLDSLNPSTQRSLRGHIYVLEKSVSKLVTSKNEQFVRVIVLQKICINI